MEFILVRHGPAPEDTEDSRGELHTNFTGFFVVRGVEDITSAAFTDLVRQIWAHVTAPPAAGGLGDGHVLIGACSGFEYCAPGGTSCGFQLSAGGQTTIPKTYVPLFAIARTKCAEDGQAPAYIDLAVDYRNTENPLGIIYCNGIADSSPPSSESSV
jgi:hypothetical protein